MYLFKSLLGFLYKRVFEKNSLFILLQKKTNFVDTCFWWGSDNIFLRNFILSEQEITIGCVYKYSYEPPLLLFFFPGYSTSTDGHLIELCLTAVKFARKKGNIVLASRLLRQCGNGSNDDEQEDDLSPKFRQLTLEGTLGEKWGPELQIEKAKVLRAAGKKKDTH